jgi:hypothetical protein
MNNTNTNTLKNLNILLQSQGYNFEALFRSRLAGPYNKKLRQAVLLILTGKKMPVAQCGVTRIEEHLFNLFGPASWTCDADRINKTVATMQGYLQS